MYRNEIAPIFYYGISTKTNEKDIIIPNLQPLTEKVLTECPCMYQGNIHRYGDCEILYACVNKYFTFTIFAIYCILTLDLD